MVASDRRQSDDQSNQGEPRPHVRSPISVWDGGYNSQYRARKRKCPLDWTSGVLNSSSNLATLHLIGASATIDPGGGALTTGDTISLESSTNPFSGTTTGTTATFNPGTLDFDNDSGLSIDNLCSADMDAPQNATIAFTANLTTFNTGTINIKAGGTLTVTGPGTWNGEGLPLTNNGGTFEITGNALASFSPPPNTAQYTVIQNSGTIKLHTGSSLTANSLGLNLAGGTLLIVADSPNGATDPATLNLDTTAGGQLWFHNKSVISFTTPQGPQLMWTFQVNGNVEWDGGTYQPRVNAAGGISDTMVISGTLTVDPAMGATTTIAPQTINYNGALPVQFTRTILKAMKGISGANNVTVPGNNPTYNLTGTQPGGDERDWQLVPG